MRWGPCHATVQRFFHHLLLNNSVLSVYQRALPEASPCAALLLQLVFRMSCPSSVTLPPRHRSSVVWVYLCPAASAISDGGVRFGGLHSLAARASGASLVFISESVSLNLPNTSTMTVIIVFSPSADSGTTPVSAAYSYVQHSSRLVHIYSGVSAATKKTLNSSGGSTLPFGHLCVTEIPSVQ